MAHELSSTNGIVSFADSAVRADGKVDAWHRLGTPVGHAMTAQEALDSAYLANWNVRKRPIFVDVRDDFKTGPDGQQVRGMKVPGQYATVFDNPINNEITPLGVVGERYTPIQNESLTEFADALVDESGAHYETAGSLRDYTQTFITMKMPRQMVLTGLDGSQDVTDWYLALFNSHDGSSSMFGLVTSVRVVCANTANAAIAGAKSKFTIRHTSGWKGNVQQAREQLGLAFEYEQAFEESARALFDQPFTNSDMKSFTEELVDLAKAEADSATATRRRNEANAIYKLWVSSPTIKGTPVAGTKYGAFQAVTEYVDHFANVRGAGTAEDLARATRTIAQATTSNVGLKADGWKLLTTV